MTTPSLPQAIDSLISSADALTTTEKETSSADSGVMSWLSPNSDASKKFELEKRKNATSAIWKFYHVIKSDSVGNGDLFKKDHEYAACNTCGKALVYRANGKATNGPLMNHLRTHGMLQFEELDTAINNAMEEAEKQCRKLCTGIIAWSPLYQQACDKVMYWTLVCDELNGKRVNIRKIRSLRKKLRIPRDNNMTIDIATSKLKMAIRNRKQCKRYAPELQLEYRHRLALAKEAEDNILAAIHIRNLTQQETTRALFWRIRYLERKMVNLSTTRLLVTNKQGDNKEIVQPHSIVQHIIDSNEKKFHQTEGFCPLSKGQLLKDIGLFGEGSKVPEILNGTYKCPPGTSDITKSFLRQLKYPAIRTEYAPVSFEEYKAGWIKTKESTSSCGVHFGHYKAAMHNPQLARLLYQRAMIPMLTGYSPQ